MNDLTTLQDTPGIWINIISFEERYDDIKLLHGKEDFDLGEIIDKVRRFFPMYKENIRESFNVQIVQTNIDKINYLTEEKLKELDESDEGEMNTNFYANLFSNINLELKTYSEHLSSKYFIGLVREI